MIYNLLAFCDCFWLVKLNFSAAANSGDLEQFVKALEKHADKTEGATKSTTPTATPAELEENGHQKESKKDDNEMNLGWIW